MKEYLLELALQPSTYRGLIWLLTAAGITISPDMLPHLIAVGGALSGLIGFLCRD